MKNGPVQKSAAHHTDDPGMVCGIINTGEYSEAVFLVMCDPSTNEL